MKKSIIVGTNQYAQMLRYYIENENEYKDTIFAYSVDKEYISEIVSPDGLPIISLEEILDSNDDYRFYLALGYSKMNTIREKIFNLLMKSKREIMSYIHPSAIISEKAVIGIGNILFENIVIQPYVQIGHCNVFQASVNILHHTVIGDYNFLSGGSLINGQVTIKNNCFIGSNSTIRNRITIGNHSLIGAGCYVNDSVDDSKVVVPSRSVILSKSSFEIKI